MCDTGTDTRDYFLITTSINAAHGSTLWLWLRIVDAFLRWAKIILHIPLKITVIGRRIEVVEKFYSLYVFYVEVAIDFFHNTHFLHYQKHHT